VEIRGSLAAILKNLAVDDGVVSLACSNPSEIKTTMANISAAARSYQLSSTLTACLVSSGFSLNLSSRVATAVLPYVLATIMASVFHSPGFPRSISLPEAIHPLIVPK